MESNNISNHIKRLHEVKNKIDKYIDNLPKDDNCWVDFLDTSARTYKYSLGNQLAIHLQRDDVSACASMDFWNGLGYYVKGGVRGKHLSWEERLTIERLLLKKKSKKEIAEAIGCCLATVYNEIKRFTYKHTVEDKDVIRYSPDRAETLYSEKLQKKGKPAKLALDKEQRIYLEELIIDKEYSPAAALMQARKDGKAFKYPVKSVNTVYKAIRDGLFENVTLGILPEKGRYRKRKDKRKKVQVQKRAVKGDSIEKRPDILDRVEFGHWEMDTVVGEQSNRKNLLVLTERKTRMETILILKKHTTDEVRKAMSRLEKNMVGISIRYSKV